MFGEGISSRSGEDSVNNSSVESKSKSPHQDLYKMKFNPDEAKRLQGGESEVKASQDNSSEFSTNNVTDFGDGSLNLNIASLDNREENTGFTEKVEDQANERQERSQEKQEKSRVEQRIDAIRSRLEQISQELQFESTNKERLDEEVLAYEAAIDKNTEEHNQLSDKVNALKLEINKTKRNTISLFANGLKVVKNLAMGKHEEVHKIITEMGNSVDAHEKATSEHEEARAILDDNEDERVVLDDEYANTVDERKECVDKIFRLKRQQAEAEKQIGMLREEAANESWSEMWKDAQEGIKSEMGTNNMPAFRRELSKQQEELDENLEADLGELDIYRNPSRIQRMMRTEEELQRDEKRVKEIEETLKEEYTNATAVIKSKQEKVDRYFPTWQERVDLIGRNRLVRGALHTLKRKIMMRVFGIN